MTKKNAKRTVTILLAILLLVSIVLPITSMAYDWWIMESVYTITSREPVTEAGSKARVFLPDLSVKTIDGIEMDAVYSVSKDGEDFASGDYVPGTYIELDGAGEYLFTVQGVDAKNAYTFTVTATEDAPSLIAEGIVPLYVGLSEPFVTPAAVIEKNGEQKQAEISLKMANGDEYQYDGNSIPEAGFMTVVYSADFDSETVEYAYEVTVTDDTLGFYDENGVFYPAGQTPREDLDIHGAVLNGETGKTYTFSKIIDLSQATKNDPLIVLSNGSDTCVNIVPKIKIVDAHNPQNYIEIYGRASADNADMVYSIAGAPGQAQIGHLGGGFYYNGPYFGTETTFPRSCAVGDSFPATYYYDAAEKALYANWYGSINLVADFDADYQFKKWDGFSTGEVKIVIERIREDDFFCVEAIAGQSLAEGAGNYAAPSLAVAADAFDTVPYGVVGREYPVFKATAVDMLEYELPIDVHVFKGYNMSSGVETDIENDAFVPFDAGFYTIFYSAMDSFGNKTVRKIIVPVFDADEIPGVTAEIEGIPESAFVGDKVMLPEPKNIQGGSGELSCAINLIAPDGTVTPADGDYIIIPAAGKNTVQYVFTDFIGMEHTLDYEINCTKTDAPILYTLPMPDTLPNGKTLILPEAEFAADDSVSVEVSATIDGKKIDVTDNTVTPVTKNEQAELVITYTAKNGAGKTAAKDYSITLLGSDLSDRLTFFLPVSGTVEKEQRESSIHFTTMDSDAAVRFTGSVLADKLSVLLSVDGEMNDSDRLTVTAYDAMDSSISVRFDIVKMPDGNEASGSQVFINGTQVNDMIGNFYGGVENLGLTYKKNSMSVVDSAGNSLGTVKTLENGKPFEGFPCGEVNLVFSVGTVGEGGFGFDIVQINNQTFADPNMFFDNYPEIIINGTLQLQAELGDTITVPTARGADVLSPNTTLTIDVRKGTDMILQGQSADTPFEVTLDQYGTYFVVYNYSDGMVERSVTYPVQIIEHTAPTVEEPKLPETAKQGEKVSLPLLTATDDYSAQVTVSMLIQEPNGCMKNIDPEDPSFTATQIGTYTVFYYIYDECYNYQMLTYQIIVK